MRLQILSLRGADGETRTRTAFATAPSRRRVYQFHHVGGKTMYFLIKNLPYHLYSTSYSGIRLAFEPPSTSGTLPSRSKEDSSSDLISDPLSDSSI